ncbi:hypothetical protein SAMN04487948_1095 [Halogranum amylolyticum]|uniref:Uncharacterized protein n=1 Tax=Halogranum amylolyticum TaxID=660520 RepID=A0A1H8TYY4_9EURY|nr:hypothetical protein [Halogranum amylolyticum]SEO96065.1 hypothetical protein SAMN04487948_1095 [Halogranum amylolyticum]
MNKSTKKRLKRDAKRKAQNKADSVKNLDLSLELSLTNLLIVGLIGVGVWTFMGNKIIITDSQKVFIGSVIGVGFLLFPASAWITLQMWDPKKTFVVKVDASIKSVVNMWYASPDMWQDVTMVSGGPYEFQMRGYTVKLVDEFEHVDDISESDEIAKHVPDDAEGYVATGSWLDEADDSEILSERENIRANRRRNNLWSIVGRKLYILKEQIAQDVEDQHHHELQNRSMEMTLFDGGDSVKDAIGNRVPEFRDLDENKPMEDVIEDEILEALNNENTQETAVNSDE